ncbi:MAG: hypothetical protein IK063_01675 [Clostridia bacterium]|nr:hypothetical protein [Clostridia bacterium]
MIKVLGKNNDLMTEDGKITKQGYAALVISTVFGVCLFLTGRSVYGKRKANRDLRR